MNYRVWALTPPPASSIRNVIVYTNANCSKIDCIYLWQTSSHIICNNSTDVDTFLSLFLSLSSSCFLSFFSSLLLFSFVLLLAHSFACVLTFPTANGKISLNIFRFFFIDTHTHSHARTHRIMKPQEFLINNVPYQIQK